MNSNLILIAFVTTLAAVFFAILIWRRVYISIRPAQSALLLSWGKFIEEMSKPGLYFRPRLLLPGQRLIYVSRQLDSEVFRDVHLNDLDGTTMRIDLWVEYQVKDARKSVFAVESWQDSLRHLVAHVLMTKIGSVRLDDLLVKRDSLTEEILKELQAEAEEWGISVEAALIQDVRLLPEISRQLFNRVAARIEMKKARLEEEGRIQVQTIEAETQLNIAELHARAKSMHPLAVARAYERLANNVEVIEGYQELHQLSLVQPSKLVSFVGFQSGEVRPLDAMMIPQDNEKQVGHS